MYLKSLKFVLGGPALALAVAGGPSYAMKTPTGPKLDPIYDWTLSGPYSGSGTLTDTGGVITAFTGTLDGMTVEQLGSTSGAPTVSPSGLFTYDNLIDPTNPTQYLDKLGVFFSLNGAGEANLWGNGGGAYSLWSEVGGTFVIQQPVGESFSINSVVSSAPEPATWAMMLIGFGAIGSLMRSLGLKARDGFAAV